MKKLKSVLRWFVMNGLWYSMGALGTAAAVGWAWNIFAFMTWLTFLFAGLMFAGVAAGEYIKQPIDFPAPPVPLWIDITLDMALTLLVVAFGHWFYGLMLIFQLYALIYCFTRPKPATTVAP